MKFIPLFTASLVFFGCGILSLIFGLPERYIERELTTDEMIGDWHITPKSEMDVNLWVDQHPDWGIHAPWKTITLNKDGSCTVAIEIGWLRESGRYSKEVLANNMLSCFWNLTEDENLSGKISPVLELEFNYPKNYTTKFSLYIFEENDELIIWSFIGDPDDFQPQDFIKVPAG